MLHNIHRKQLVLLSVSLAAVLGLYWNWLERPLMKISTELSPKLKKLELESLPSDVSPEAALSEIKQKVSHLRNEILAIEESTKEQEEKRGQLTTLVHPLPHHVGLLEELSDLFRSEGLEIVSQQNLQTLGVPKEIIPFLEPLATLVEETRYEGTDWSGVEIELQGDFGTVVQAIVRIEKEFDHVWVTRLALQPCQVDNLSRWWTIHLVF